MFKHNATTDEHFPRHAAISDDGPPELGPADVGELNSQWSQPLPPHTAPTVSPEKARESPEKPGGSPGAIPVGVPANAVHLPPLRFVRPNGSFETRGNERPGRGL